MNIKETKLWKPITSSFSQELLRKQQDIIILLFPSISQLPNTRLTLRGEKKKSVYRLHRSYRSSSEERPWMSSHRWCTETRRTSAFPSETARKITNYSLEPLSASALQTLCFLLFPFLLNLNNHQTQKHFITYKTKFSQETNKQNKTNF